jgi:hypothetical protein
MRIFNCGGFKSLPFINLRAARASDPRRWAGMRHKTAWGRWFGVELNYEASDLHGHLCSGWVRG